MSYVLSKKTVSTAKGVGVSSEKYPKLHLVDVMSDTWYRSPPGYVDSTVILTTKLRKCGQFFPKVFSTNYGRYRSRLTTKKSQEKSLVIFVENVCKVVHPETDFKIGFL